MTDLILAIATGLAFATGLMPSIATLMLALLAWRIMPGHAGVALCGVVLLVGGMAARNRARREIR